ncbi:glycosyltransferase family 2 protein [Candidatus Uhrbacteria bacterium]|nr:glycosyltransferase family 2 protein [Candidatus Uhrbacteria bacterium]
MISIIIPSYNSAKQLSATLDATLSQSMKDIEIIVVDDGSTDNTACILEQYRDRLTIIKQEHAGRCAARNNGFAASKGEYVIFLDAAAVMRPNMLEKLFAALQANPDRAFAYSSFRWGWKEFRSFPYDKERLRGMNYIHTSALIRRERFPGFDPKIEKFNDWDVWLTMMEKGSYGIYVPEVLFTVRQHRATASAWLPSLVYRLPLKKLGIHIPSAERYEQWKCIVQKKHNL